MDRITGRLVDSAANQDWLVEGRWRYNNTLTCNFWIGGVVEAGQHSKEMGLQTSPSLRTLPSLKFWTDVFGTTFEK